MSEDGTRLMQIQSDRVYLNWRKLNDAVYPSFNDADGRSGLLSEVLEELTRFDGFLEERLGTGIRPLFVEMSMFDAFVQGRHWSTVGDLTVVVPALRPFVAGASSLPRLQLTFDGETAFGVGRTAMQKAQGGV